MAEENPVDSGLKAAKEPMGGAPPLSGARSASGTPRRYTRSKLRRNVLLLVAALLVIVGGVFFWRYLNTYESTDDAQVDVHLYPISSRISGYVVKVNVGDNQSVQKGTVLVEIDPKDYEVAVAQAQANLASAEATARSMNSDVPIPSVPPARQLKLTSRRGAH